MDLFDLKVEIFDAMHDAMRQHDKNMHIHARICTARGTTMVRLRMMSAHTR